MKQLYLSRKLLYLATLIHMLSIYSVAVYEKSLPSDYLPANSILHFPFVAEFYQDFFLITFLLLIVGILIRTSSRLISIPIYLLVTNLENSLFQVLDGGSNISHLALFYLMLSNELSSTEYERLLSKSAKWLLIFQISLMYLTTGVLKLVAPLWQQGVALFYVLTSFEYSSPFIAKTVWKLPPILYVIPNYVIIIYQLTFPLSLFEKSVKLAYLIFGVIFHIFIALFVGLPTFALQVLSLYPVLLDDETTATLERLFLKPLHRFQKFPLRLFKRISLS